MRDSAAPPYAVQKDRTMIYNMMVNQDVKLATVVSKDFAQLYVEKKKGEVEMDTIPAVEHGLVKLLAGKRSADR
ncbi:DEKNAAC102489 [Brettanomyces naardenensis]|uniref:DEKNAAC102489 n=1 Tax=Brettanomyces naardenensis TaxID=13370 RepID=A0A448YLG8_BRENA|nr:DEKNAAC102489 [Brettanomyces naardenensis]